MNVSDSIAIAYDATVDVARELQTVAGTRLRVICSEHGWLFDDRVKSLESCLSKLDSGSGPIEELVDMYAATVVVPTQNELDHASAQILSRFSGDLKPRRHSSAEVFAYDDIHILAKLEGMVSPMSVSKSALERRFEIQVRTGLQYSWWKATHDQIYKSAAAEDHSWAMVRSSGQARASLELLDGVLSDLPRASAMLRQAPPGSDYDDGSRRLLDFWPRAAWPSDIHRFIGSVDALLSVCGMDLEGARAALSDLKMAPALASRQISPAQAVSAALWLARGGGFVSALKAHNKRILVTAEMQTLCPWIRTSADVAFSP